MNLIDRDTLNDYLGKWADDFYENPENSDADFMDGYCMTLNQIHSGAVPVIDAIPVKWIKEYIRTHPASTDIYFKWMIDEWKAEHENEMNRVKKGVK